MVNTQGRESGGSWFETCSGVWYPRRRPCGVAINTLVDWNKLAGETSSFLVGDSENPLRLPLGGVTFPAVKICCFFFLNSCTLSPRIWADRKQKRSHRTQQVLMAA